MAEIDDSLYPKPPGQNNLIGMAGQIVGVRNALLQGQQQQQALQRGQVALSAEQLANDINHWGSMAQRFGGLESSPPGTLNKTRLVQEGAQMVADGVASSSQVARELAIAPDVITKPDGSVDDTPVRKFIQTLRMQAMDNAAQLAAMHPAPQTFGIGGHTVLGTFPAQGQSTILQSIPNTIAPGTAVTNPSDLSQSFTGGTQPPPSGPIGGSPTGGAAAAPPQTATGGQPPQANAAPSGAAPGTLMAAPSPGAVEAAATQAKLSGQQYASLQAASENIPTQAALLSNMRGLLNQFSGGPAAEIIKRGESLVNEMTGLKLGAKEAAAYDSFQKQATQLAQQTFGSLGGTGTDAKLDSAMHTNPSGFLSNMSNKEIVALLQGNLDALKAKAAAGQAYMQAHGPTSFGQFQTEFNAHFDPRVFQITHLDSASRAQMLADMSKNERKDFLKAFSYAESQGWVNRNRLQGE